MLVQDYERICAHILQPAARLGDNLAWLMNGIVDRAHTDSMPVSTDGLI